MSDETGDVYSYDEVPYSSWPYPQSHPDRLATMATIFGMEPQPIDHARVLELGCAAAGNLIPMAELLPHSQFIGIDLSARQLDEGKQVVEKLGLKNIQLARENILNLGQELGKFHYIIAHGVYSWVGEDVQDKILDICAHNMEPNGVGYVSYNTYPGWRMRGMLRDMMCYHTRQFREPRERVAQARALLGFLAQKVPTKENPYGAFLHQEAEAFNRYEDHYLLHDHLEEVNEPTYFYRLIERAERHGLQYLAEADLSVMSASNFPAEVEFTLQRVAKDIIQMEQYMDFLRNRMFRQTLLCHADVSLKRTLDPAYVTNLHVASPLKEEPAKDDAAGAQGYEFRGPATSLRTNDPLMRAALVHLSEHWPRWVPFQSVLAAARSRVSTEPVQDAARITQDARRLGEELLRCCVKRVLEFRSTAAAFVTDVSDRPVAAPVARLQAESRAVVTNRRHERVPLNDLGRHVIRYLDGSRDHGALLDELLGLVDRQVLVVHDEGRPVGDRGRAKGILAGALDQTLRDLAARALLVS